MGNEVIQADREAAVGLLSASWCPKDHRDIMDVFAEAFARHRLATSPTPAPVGEAAELVSKIGEYIGLTGYNIKPDVVEAVRQAVTALGAIAVRAAPAPVAMQEGEVNEEAVERGAQAMWLTDENWDSRKVWASLPEYGRDLWRDRARACLLAALRASSPVGEGSDAAA